VALQADVIITMVPDSPHVEAALFGDDGVAAGLSPGKFVVDMSSISPLATKEFARKINESVAPGRQRRTRLPRRPVGFAPHPGCDARDHAAETVSIQTSHLDDSDRVGHGRC
jgi:hypothetical protein